VEWAEVFATVRERGMTWVMIVMSWVTASNMGGGYYVSSVPGFASKATCEAAASVVKDRREKSITTACVQQ
jgi:hypothetical protein